jgi:hypothetical protein
MHKLGRSSRSEDAEVCPVGLFGIDPLVMAAEGDEASLRADVPAIHVFLAYCSEARRGCRAQGRA